MNKYIICWHLIFAIICNPKYVWHTFHYETSSISKGKINIGYSIGYYRIKLSLSHHFCGKNPRGSGRPPWRTDATYFFQDQLLWLKADDQWFLKWRGENIVYINFKFWQRTPISHFVSHYSLTSMLALGWCLEHIFGFILYNFTNLGFILFWEGLINQWIWP